MSRPPAEGFFFEIFAMERNFPMKQLLSLALALLLCFSTGLFAAADPSEDELSRTAEDALRYLDSKKAGDWSIFVHALHRQEFAKKTVSALELDIAEHAAGGFRSLTDLEKAILNAVAAGKYPHAAEGADLLSMLGEYTDLTAQGLEGAAMALLAVDALGSELPEDSFWSRSDAVSSVLYFQAEDGGFSSAAGLRPDPASTALALTALSPYRGQPDTAAAVEQGLRWLSQAQNPDGSYSDAVGSRSCESTAAVLTALCSLDVSPENSRFAGSASLLQALLSFRAEKRGFAREPGQKADVAATEQALIALSAYETRSNPYDFTQSFTPEKKKSVGESMASFFGITVAVVILIYGALLLTGKIGEKFGKHPEESLPADISGNSEAPGSAPGCAAENPENPDAAPDGAASGKKPAGPGAT